jgi:hypothetical protein
MSRITSIISLATTVLASDPGNYLTPLRYTSEGRPTVKVIGPGGRFYSLNLSSGRFVALPSEMDEGAPVGVSFEHNQLGMVSYSFVNIPIAFSASRTGYPYIGIGPESAVTSQAGPISVIRGPRSASMVLYSTLEYFASACKPGTLTSFNEALPVSVKLMNETITESFGDARVSFGAKQRARASVPEPMFVRLDELYRLSGLTPSRGMVGKYVDCTAEKVATIPSIELNYESGSFVIRPEEMLLLGQDGTCYSQLWPADEDETLIVEPLLLLSRNVRVSKDSSWDFCESSAMV